VCAGQHPLLGIGGDLDERCGDRRSRPQYDQWWDDLVDPGHLSRDVNERGGLLSVACPSAGDCWVGAQNVSDTTTPGAVFSTVRPKQPPPPVLPGPRRLGPRLGRSLLVSEFASRHVPEDRAQHATGEPGCLRRDHRLHARRSVHRCSGVPSGASERSAVDHHRHWRQRRCRLLRLLEPRVPSAGRSDHGAKPSRRCWPGFTLPRRARPYSA
jgi:hypothetical protein